MSDPPTPPPHTLTPLWSSPTTGRSMTSSLPVCQSSLCRWKDGLFVSLWTQRCSKSELSDAFHLLLDLKCFFLLIDWPERCDLLRFFGSGGKPRLFVDYSSERSDLNWRERLLQTVYQNGRTSDAGAALLPSSECQWLRTVLQPHRCQVCADASDRPRMSSACKCQRLMK